MSDKQSCKLLAIEKYPSHSPNEVSHQLRLSPLRIPTSFSSAPQSHYELQFYLVLDVWLDAARIA